MRTRAITSTEIMCGSCGLKLDTCDRCLEWIMFGDDINCDDDNLNHECKNCY